MFDKLWWFIVWCFGSLPWLVMAFAAALALLKRKKSFPLMLQVIGAGSYFLVAVLREVILKMLDWTQASAEVFRAAYSIFTFLWIVALLLFAAGFCWEKISQWRAAPSQVTAVRVN